MLTLLSGWHLSDVPTVRRRMRAVLSANQFSIMHAITLVQS
jgi:hypothetical protein